MRKPDYPRLDWRSARVLDTPRPCVICGRPALLLSPGKGVPCHKMCAEAWLAARKLAGVEWSSPRGGRPRPAGPTPGVQGGVPSGVPCGPGGGLAAVPGPSRGDDHLQLPLFPSSPSAAGGPGAAPPESPRRAVHSRRDHRARLAD